MLNMEVFACDVKSLSFKNKFQKYYPLSIPKMKQCWLLNQLKDFWEVY